MFEQADLDPLGQVRQLVDREDPAVGARDQAVVERQLVAEVAALGDPDRVDLADQVGDRDVRRRELLGVAPVARQPVDRRVVAVLVDDRAGRSAMIGAYGSSFSSPPRTTGSASSSRPTSEPGQPRLRLAALAEEDEVLAGDDRVLDRGQDGLVVADDARDDRPPGGEPGQQVRPELLLDGPARSSRTARSSPRVCGRLVGSTG